MLEQFIELNDRVIDRFSADKRKYIPKERLGATDDCGFSPFSIDNKPKHGSPDHARDIAFQKITRAFEARKLLPKSSGYLDQPAEEGSN